LPFDKVDNIKTTVGMLKKDSTAWDATLRC
jgi:hypothetical protein